MILYLILFVLVLIGLVALEFWLIRAQKLITNYKDAPIHLFCTSDLTQEVLRVLQDTGCDLIYLRVSDDPPLPDAPPDTHCTLILNVNAHGDSQRYCHLLSELAHLPGVLGLGEGEGIPV